MKAPRTWCCHYVISSFSSQIQAAPMQSILARLRHQEYIRLVIFSDHTILKEPVEQWPLCNCLIAFYSKVTTVCFCYVWRRGTSGELQYQCMQGAISHTSRRPPDVILHILLYCLSLIPSLVPRPSITDNVVVKLLHVHRMMSGGRTGVWHFQ